MSREEAQNILDFRLVLEGGYLRQSIGHITEENLAELAEIDERCKQSTDSVWDHWEANTAFHLKLISFSGNAYAYQELERTMNLFFHMLPTHLRSPAKETRAKACLKKAFGLLFVTIQIHAKRKKGTGLLQ